MCGRGCGCPNFPESQKRTTFMYKPKPLIALLPLVFSSMALGQTPVGTAFTYQGRLTDNGAPANGQYDLQFALYNFAAIGSPFAGPVTVQDVNVSNGLFTTTIDFGQPIPSGFACWMGISVRPGASTGGFTIMMP